MKKIFLAFLTLFLFYIADAQQKRPKLVVGIVVDQMREEFLYRFYDQYGENGFKRLMREGFNCRNVFYNYIPTFTGPGHASIYAGTTPAIHGIVANEWYDRDQRKSVYCVNDNLEQLVGVDSKNTGVSPRYLLTTNICDELKISTNGKAKVIGISMKDRAAILPAGHMADAAYWFDQNSGNFISSTYYLKQLPDWVGKFNAAGNADKYLTVWTPLKQESAYQNSTSDDQDYEEKFKGKQKPVFPYDLKELSAKNPPKYSVLYESPFSNSILTDFAIEAIKNENLGKNVTTDFLAISFSATDAVGHKFGPLSVELNDTYLRLDADLGRLLDALDKYVGKGNYTLFLTADHGDVDPPQYLIEHRVPAGFLNPVILKKEASDFLSKKYGDGDWISAYTNNQFYLNRKLISEKNLNIAEVQEQLADLMRNEEGVAKVLTANQLTSYDMTLKPELLVQMGFNYKRSGDVFLISEPGWVDDLGHVSTHGTGYSYDTNVPLIWFGMAINKGESLERYEITDIVPTLSILLKIKYPSGSIGNPIIKALAQ